jgi:uncharacterized protein (TIGR02453 family)
VKSDSHFTPATLRFLRGLKRHNDREWFAANKNRFLEDVEAPMQRFITDFGERLRGISKAFVADPRRTGGSMFRIYRDTRFSSDKSPFKTWIAARFRHEASRKGENVPGFYLHVDATDSFGGGGLYHAELPAVTRVRARIVSEPKVWSAAIRGGVEVQGDRLKRVPAGFDPEHRHACDLKLKDFYTMTSFTEAEVVSPDFLDRYVEVCRTAAPLMRFLTEALELRW